MAEVSPWGAAQSDGRIDRDRFHPLSGHEADLLGYCPLDEVASHGTALKTPDRTGRHKTLIRLRVIKVLGKK